MKELPLDRIATADRKGNRIYLYPVSVKGYYRKLRSQLGLILIVIFLAMPWLRIGGHQAILLDVPRRRFAILGLTFWAHDAPLLVFVFGGLLILLGLVTAIWGRVWCGWACPQTVFVDRVFRKIEEWIEGDSLTRKKLDLSPWSFQKVLKKSEKWFAFTLCALVISHSFLAYFVGTDTLALMIGRAPLENPASFLVMAGVTAALLFDFGWFREQFCTMLCPYGRFQSVLMDDESQVVAYDLKRGEPRRGLAQSSENAGDCVNCYRCVQVCPTGIDIRRGVQLECIACTACMDACDDVMARMDKPLGLIRYGTQATTEGTEADVKSGVRAVAGAGRRNAWPMRPRPLLSLGLLLACVAGLTLTVLKRVPVELTLIRAVDAPYQVVSGLNGEAEVINHFKMDLRNQTFFQQSLSFAVTSELEAKGVRLVVSNHLPSLPAGESERADLFVRFPKSLLSSGHSRIFIQIRSDPLVFPEKTHTLHQEVILVGPFL